ncbi:hypothetical protein [Rhodococcus sp. IEGM 1374]|uniref:hypothetical protein n=1 Tax=Rhodococcus sp. IEGM 1374 TaxID=3082221 RepID=UPI002954E4D3|nr:hypothetical protein [Rhodococcus sp. IEGM 1374]MDV7992099.1 hypothetical protein [Rhodococcus sp. IEGM 1374]
MKVASRKLSEDLYALSGWGNGFADLSELTAYWKAGKFLDNPTIHRWSPDVLLGEFYGRMLYTLPAYDLSYLLRKFQDEGLTVLLRWNRDMGGRAAMKQWDKRWCIGTLDMPQGEYPIADTPEDAAAMLAIQLFKNAVLTRGDS